MQISMLDDKEKKEKKNLEKLDATKS